MALVHYTHCPVCGSTAISPALQVTDYSVSKEQFDIWQCSRCTLRFTQNVPDEASVAPYYASADYISHSNTTKGLLARLYQGVRRFTLAQKAALVMRYTKKVGSLLDMGAGVGAFVGEMQSRGWQAFGIEPDAGARANAKKTFGVELQTPATMADVTPQSLDAITLWHVLEHVHDLQGYMARLSTMLKADGRLFIAVPNYTSTDAANYKEAWAAYDVPRHLYHFTPAAIKALAHRHHLLVDVIKPMWFDAFYIALLSSKYKNGRTGWLSAGVTALQSNLTAAADKNRCSSIIYVLKKA